MAPLPFAKLETFPDIGQVLAVVEDTDTGIPCVAVRVAAPSGDTIVRVEYTFAQSATPEQDAAAFFTTITRDELHRMGQEIVAQATPLLQDTPS